MEQLMLAREKDSVAGLGDTNFTAFLSPAGSGALTWGIGPSITLPSTNGPRSLIRTITLSRVSRRVTLTSDPKGNVLCAAVIAYMS